jgi:uncharacterized Zn finger protein
MEEEKKKNGLRACPICPICGSKKFKIVENSKYQVIVECIACGKRLWI